MGMPEEERTRPEHIVDIHIAGRIPEPAALATAEYEAHILREHITA